MTAASNQTDQPTVLLATQSRLSAKSITKLLQDQFAIIEVEDSETAWDYLTSKTTIHLLLADINMCLDQFGILERIQTAQQPAIRSLPILLLIKESNDDLDREEALKKGASDFLSMPFASSELIARVRMHAKVFSPKTITKIDEVQSSGDLLKDMAQENFFESRLDQELSFSVRHKVPVSACRIEVDNLDALEEQYSHKVVHQIILHFAKVLQNTVRLEDTVSYSGHGRFSLLYPAANALGALAALKRIQKAIDKTQLKITDTSLTLSFSGAIYTCLASEEITTDYIQNELDERIKQALIKGKGEIVTSGHKSDDKIVPSIERALKLIEDNKTEDLAQYSQALLTRILPLLAFTNEHLHLYLEDTLEELEEAANQEKPS